METERIEQEMTEGHTSETNRSPLDLYSSKELGAIYQPDETVFRVWAPTAGSVVLNLYEAPIGRKAKRITMMRDYDGVWEAAVGGDLLGVYYTYSAGGDDPRFDPKRELLDPYARCITASDGRSIVVHDETPVADRPAFPISEAIIYEMNIRDFTIDPDSGIQRRGKYLGLTEAGTHLTERMDVTTGLDHLVELGVNVVQLMPITEFMSSESEDLYGWGYDVVHHNSPDGWYATERLDARRVSEVKRMVDALHRRGIRITLDMVYNHTFENIGAGRIYSFEGLVPGYYYRLREDGSYWNGSGTGNEFRTEAPMARRYILDSLKRWVTEYKIDGFRFDLLGLIDRETIIRIVRELRAIDSNIMIYGEPWAGGATPIEISSKGLQRGQGWAVFNDHFRDALKGHIFYAREGGFIQSGEFIGALKVGIRGAVGDFADAPTETVNYIECHDNHTLWDRLVISTIDDARITDADRRAMDKLGAAILLTSQGIPFIQCGQEFLRSKGGDHNSYDKPDAVNMIRWRKKTEHRDVYEYYQGLIALRRTHPMFRWETGDEVRQSVKFLDDQLGIHVPHGCIAYMIEDISGRDEWSRAVLLFNALGKAVEIAVPQGRWVVFGDGMEAGLFPVRTHAREEIEGWVTVAPRSALILGEEREEES